MSRRPAVVLLLLTVALTAAAPAPPQRSLTTADLDGLRLRTIGPAAMSGRMVDVDVVESDTYVFYVATANGGVWKTTNNGITFTPVFEKEATHSVGDVAIFQPDPDIVWVGTGERANRQSSGWGDGVYLSEDGGESWRNVGLRESLHIGRIALHPTDPDTVFVAALGHLWGPNEERGLYRSRDRGQSWERVLGVDADTGAVDVAIDPRDPDRIYAATYQRRRTAYAFHGGGPGSGLYRSTDGGDSWIELTDAALDPDAEANPDHPHGTRVNGLPGGNLGRIGISIHRGDPRIVYATIEQGHRYNASTAYDGERHAGIYRSEDHGATWQHQSDWNPRPMYASQIAVDPNDDQRVYQMNSFSYSEDGGRTWRVPRQSIHSDDRFLWINPADSRHIIKASDGALGISYDRGERWLWVSHLPVSQYYRVSVDMRDPYLIYGGLQDNGTWVGPSATYTNAGILNSDWFSIGGGDGFLPLVDPEDPDTVYVESQYLGLARVDLATRLSQSIRPGNPEGYRFGRRNWRLYGTGEEPRALEQEMEPANWDGPFILSPHDPRTIYAGTQRLWVSRDRGGSWRDLGRMSNAWERSEVTVMGQEPDGGVASLDDGVPYFATLTVIAESPLHEGELWIGTDDGNVRRSRDGGESWTDLTTRFPGLPARTWVADIEPSTHDTATLFAAFDGHREDDYDNYLYRSDDGGDSWRSIAGDMPAGRVVRAIVQDTVNPELLFAATEFGVWLSFSGGERWIELRSNLPTLPVNDLVIHPREHDLVLGTHGRGIWILDSISALRGLTAETVAQPGALFPIRPARMIRRGGGGGRTGDMTFRGENPPVGAIVDYWLRDGVADEADEADAQAAGAGDGAAAGAMDEADASDLAVTLTVHDATGAQIRELDPSTRAGVNRIVWDLRHERWPAPARRPQPRDPVRLGGGGGFGGFGGGGGAAGPLVVPGTYTIRLTVGDQVYDSTVRVEEDPRIQVSPAARRSWTRTQLELGQLYGRTVEMCRPVVARQQEIEDGDGSAPAQLVALREECEQLQTRVLGLQGQVGRWVGPPTADQRNQRATYERVLGELRAAWSELTGEPTGGR